MLVRSWMARSPATPPLSSRAISERPPALLPPMADPLGVTFQLDGRVVVATVVFSVATVLVFCALAGARRLANRRRGSRQDRQRLRRSEAIADAAS